MTSRQMEKQYTRSQFRAIAVEVAGIIKEIKTAEDLAAVLPVFERRNPELAAKVKVVFNVTALLIKQKRELDDVDKVIIWRGDPQEIQVEGRKRSASRSGFPS